MNLLGIYFLEGTVCLRTELRGVRKSPVLRRVLIELVARTFMGEGRVIGRVDTKNPALSRVFPGGSRLTWLLLPGFYL